MCILHITTLAKLLVSTPRCAPQCAQRVSTSPPCVRIHPIPFPTPNPQNTSVFSTISEACSTTSQPFVTHESHGHSNQNVCSYRSRVDVSAWLNVRHVLTPGIMSNHVQDPGYVHQPAIRDTSHTDTSIRLFAHTNCASMYLPG